MGRLDFQRQWVKGTILNIGCADDPAGFGARATHLDIDWWTGIPNFVHGDCHHLPFPDGSFDTAVLGDVLEHCMDPEQAVREASRVARRVIITVPEELRLPEVGRHVGMGVRDRAKVMREVHGYPAEMPDEEVVVTHKKTDPRFERAYPEADMPHDGHIWRFDDAWIQKFIDASGKKPVVYQKVPECSWTNWLVVLE